ncbi:MULTISPECIES: flagellin N-terminal helical domain-containing protein [Dethiosulfovibrio]|uniref:Flagellin n=2 Tax=Dethiosulfovibrio TaxID=47054 RepID=A0ABS9EP85_9BACT|nr:MULTISPECIES: flagellin [Dethiosulfovibrio]MCF4113892.1 flagellin [Dethiosulfovibrio russensis]MCF4141695.1 flagellin [Dethiosulfovibrio marinus]MCF4143888.1 flagellin [Dethiosulfovibrio acidaminovorans]
MWQLRIYSNIASLISHNALSKINDRINKTTKRLSSGLRINSSSDDAAGLAISEKMRAQIKGLDRAAMNSQDGISMLQTAEGGLNEIHSMIQRMRELSVQAAHDVLTSGDRGHIQDEIEQLVQQVNDIANQTQFNRKKLLNGSMAALWSTSTSDINVVVSDNLLSKDVMNNVKSAAGNYKLTFSTVSNGVENIQKSNIMYLKHGTHQASVVNNTEGAGIVGMTALNMVEGSWKLESRETPFGGIHYYVGNVDSNPATVGGTIDVSPTPNIVSPGTYDIRLSDRVPMMADFDAALAAGVVDGVNMSSRAAGSNFDAEIAVAADGGGTASSSQVYRSDLSGGGTVNASGGVGDVSIDTNANNEVNLFTHYAVTGTDNRDIMAGNINVTESYVTHQNAIMTANLDYQAADDVQATVSYRASGAGNSLNAVTTYQAAVGATLDIDDGTTVTTVNIGGLNMDDIVTAINAQSGVSGVTATLNGFGSSRNIRLTNTNGVAVDVVENGVGPVDMGLTGTIGVGAFRNGTYREFNRLTILPTNNADLATVASVVDGIVGISASVVGGGAALGHIEVTGQSNYDVVLTTGGDIASELNLDHTFDGGGSHSSNQVWHNRTLTVGTDGDDLATVASTIQTGISGLVGAGFSAGVTTAGDLNGLTFSNDSVYRVRLTGVTLGELSNGNNVSATADINRGNLLFNTGNKVYVDHDVVINVGDRDALDLASALNSGVNAALGGDLLSGNNGLSPFSTVAGGGTRTIRLTNGAVSGYKIDITAGSDGSLAEVWGGAVSADRGGSDDGNVLDYDRTSSIVVAGMNVEEAYSAIDADSRFATAWLTEPEQVTPEHYGRLSITNVTTGADRRRISMTQAGTDTGDIANAERKLFESAGPLWSSTESSGGAVVNSQTLQSHDRMIVQVTWDGNRASNAARVNGTASVTVWEGGAGDVTSAQNAAAVTAAMGITGFSYDDFSIDDVDVHGSDLSIDDSWMTYTKAEVVGVSDNLGLSLYDGLYTDAGNNLGVTNGITYSFNDGVLDNSSIAINQLVRSASGIGGSASLAHNVDFGTVDSNTSFTYGERAGAGTYWDNTANVNSWYSHSYYAGDSTYYFGNGGTPVSMISNAEVYRQNDINASMMFEFDNGVLSVRAKGFDRNGTELPATADTTPYELTTAEFASLSAGADITLHGVHFTDLQIDTANLKAGDKFVINVAAAAKLDGVNTGPAIAGNFQSAANVAIDGDPFRQNSPGDWGALAQYRLADGAENGKNLNLLGYYIDPLNGNSDIPGLGYYNGSLILQAEAGGFNAGSTVGEPGGDDVGSHRVRAEINYQGNTKPSAGALVTSSYFGKMEGDGDKDINSFIGGIGYSNYSYGKRADGSYGPLNEAGSEEYNKYNGSLIFDVIETENQVVKFRIQGHVIDREGNEWYVQEDEYGMNCGPNTSKDTSVQPPVLPAEVVNPVVLFRDSDFGGLFFDEFTLGDFENWTDGDRFTLSLTASGFEDGLSEDQQQTDPALQPDIDEIDLFSDNRGTNMPHAFRFDEGVLDNSKVDLGIYQLANNIANPSGGNFHKNQVMDGTLSLMFDDYHPDGDDVIDDALSFDVIYEEGMDAGKAHYYSRVEDIAQFYDANGRYILDGNMESLTVRQDDREISVSLGSTAEVGKLAEDISERIWLDLLMQNDGQLRGEDDTVPYGYSPGLMDERDKNEILQFVNKVPGESANESVVSTLLAHSVISGKDKQLHFYGSEDLMKALGFATIQEAEEAQFRLTVSDAHNGKTVSSGTKVQAGDRISAVIANGISLDISGDIGLNRVVYNDERGTFEGDRNSVFEHYVHLADNSAFLQIGADEGEDVDLHLGDMSSEALGIDGLDVRTREEAARSITVLDSALDAVSSQRAIIGAQINRLEHTITNLDTASLNLTASKSRIVDADLAKEMMEFTKLNILVQSGMSVLAHSNQIHENVLKLLS